MLGIGAKAGKIVSGTDAVLDSVKRHIVKLILVAEDASDKTKKEMKFTCEKFNIPLIIFGNIDENSHAIGKKNRAIIAVCDIGIANNIQKIINGGG
jgi:ribosomal protein L7Ae-like RNA K-turn-binding protein